MSNITFQIIPFAFIFIVILFFLAKKKNKKTDITVHNEIPLNDYGEHKEFFENAEKKLLALTLKIEKSSLSIYKFIYVHTN